MHEYSHSNTENLSQTRATIAKIHKFFYGIVFLLQHPVDVSTNNEIVTSFNSAFKLGYDWHKNLRL